MEKAEVAIKMPAKNMLNAYMAKDVVVDFAKVPREIKLSMLQRTPKIFIKTRQVGSQFVKYVEHSYSRKALNFVFNFNYSCEIKNSSYLEYEEEYFQKQKDGTFKRAKRPVVEAECEVLFKFPGDIIRTVFSSHKGYRNPATTRGDIMKSALSKAYTKVAQTFGMSTEEEYLPAPIEDEEPEVTNAPEPNAGKSFDKTSSLPY